MKKANNPKRPSKVEAKDKPAEAPSTSVEVIKSLTSDEKQQLAKLEKVIDAKLGDFFDVGNALTGIKTNELYRETHKNFNTYCQERWGFGRSYANKLIGSAERINLLPEDVPKPANEFQIRPFLDMEPKEFPKKWEEIVHTAGEGKVTSKIVKDALGVAKRKRGRKRKAKAAVVTEETGAEIQELVESLRTAIKEKDVEGGLEQLAKLEKLLKI